MTQLLVITQVICKPGMSPVIEILQVTDRLEAAAEFVKNLLIDLRARYPSYSITYDSIGYTVHQTNPQASKRIYINISSAPLKLYEHVYK